MQAVDLSQRIDTSTPVWPGSRGPVFHTDETLDADGAFARTVTIAEHTATHVDAPAHFARSGATVDALGADRLVRPLAVLDVSARCRADPDYAVTRADVERDLAAHGPIEPGSVVAARTGWDRRRRLADPDYLTDPPRFPGFSAEAADWLIRRFAIEALAIDTPGIDPGRDAGFTVHSTTTLPRGVWHVEGLVGLDRVPARGATIVVGVLPLGGGSGAPARVFALVPDKEPSMAHRAAYRITTFLPPESVEAVLDAVEGQTPLVFGPYDRSAWWSAAGTEQFRPMAGADPTVGRAGKTEQVPTVRLEFAIPRDPGLLARVVDEGVLPSHPWQEPAVFVDECMVTATRMADDLAPEAG